MQTRLPPDVDPLIKSLWTFGWDTARIAQFIDERRKTHTGSRSIREEDVYNVLDRALGRNQSVIVKAT